MFVFQVMLYRTIGCVPIQMCCKSNYVVNWQKKMQMNVFFPHPLPLCDYYEPVYGDEQLVAAVLRSEIHFTIAKEWN